MTRRVATAVPTLLLVTVVVFALIHAVPGDPLSGSGEETVAGRLPPDRLAALRATYRLDEPLPRRYALWLRDVATGDLGRSFRDRRPVGTLIAERLEVTATLNGLALAIVVAVGLPLGIAAARRPGSRLDRWTAIAGYALYAVPVFWAALMLQSVFSVHWELFPLQGVASEGVERFGWWTRLLDRAAHLVLPAISLAYGGIAYVARFVRANLLETALPASARAARARGVRPAAIVLRHGLRQAAIPLLTLAGFLLPALVGGSVLVETVFGIPGLGQLFYDAAFARDVPVIMALTLLSGAATLTGVVLADLLYAVADPRVRRA
jgi:peptide/nickel transport system permease protein